MIYFWYDEEHCLWSWGKQCTSDEENFVLYRGFDTWDELLEAWHNRKEENGNAKENGTSSCG